MRDYKAYVEAILNKKKPAISRASLHEEAMELLAARRKIHDHEAIRDFTRLTLIASDMLTTVDAKRRDALLKELAKSIRLGDQPVAAKDLKKVVESGKEHLAGLQKGNYGVTVVQGIVTYSYWDYAYISINTRTREVAMLRKPEIKTATTFVKYVLEQYGLVYDKDTDFYKLPERIA